MNHANINVAEFKFVVISVISHALKIVLHAKKSARQNVLIQPAFSNAKKFVLYVWKNVKTNVLIQNAQRCVPNRVIESHVTYLAINCNNVVIPVLVFAESLARQTSAEFASLIVTPSQR